MNMQKMMRALENDESVLNVFLTIPSPWTAELIAHAGWDALTIDMQHGLMDFNTALGMLHAMSSTDVVPFVRLPWNEPSVIMKVLDAGAMGVICPMINTAADVEAFVGACRYPPRGYRSFGPIRSRLYAEGDYRAYADRHVLTFAMIETAESVDNLDAIAAVPGLNGIYIGPHDLSVSMGLDRIADFKHSELHGVIERVAVLCRRHGLIAGIFASSTDEAAMVAGLGYRFVTYQHDSGLLEEIARSRLDELKRKIGRGEMR